MLHWGGSSALCGVIYWDKIIYWGNILISTRMKNDKVGKGWGTTIYTNYTTQDCLDLF